MREARRQGELPGITVDGNGGLFSLSVGRLELTLWLVGKIWQKTDIPEDEQWFNFLFASFSAPSKTRRGATNRVVSPGPQPLSYTAYPSQGILTSSSTPKISRGTFKTRADFYPHRDSKLAPAVDLPLNPIVGPPVRCTWCVSDTLITEFYNPFSSGKPPR